MKIKALIFDLDGTLLNTLVSINYYLNKTLESYGFERITLDETKVFVGEGAAKLVVRALEAQGFDTEADKERVKEITRAYVEGYDSAPDYLTAPYEGIPELLDELKKKGYKLGVVSNKPHSTVAPLVHKFFGGIFDFVIGGKEGVRLKPHSDMPILALEALGVLSSEVMYLGDTSTDMLTGKGFSAGKTVGVSWGFRDRCELSYNGADAVADTPCEILNMLE